MRFLSTFRLIGMCLSMAVLVAACGDSADTPTAASDPTSAESTGAVETDGEAGATTAVRGIDDDTITLGAILDLSGPYNAAGVLMRDGVEAWVQQVNAEGGVHGRQVEVIYEDNQSDPSATLAAANKLIFNDGVFALAGVHGSAAFGAILDLVEEEEVISFSLGLSEEMYNPTKDHVFVAAVPYAAQMERGVHHLVEEMGVARPAVLYQDDEFGESGLAGFDAAAEALGLEVAARETFVRGSDDVSAQVQAIIDAGADAVACVCIYTQSGLLRRELGRLGADDVPAFAINPSVGPPYFEIAGGSADNFFAADYYAHPGDPTYEAADAAVQAAHGRAAETFDLFGLVNTAVLLQAMQDAAELTPSGVVEALNAMDGVEIPGFVPPVEFGPDQHVASLASAVYAANPEDGDWQRVGDPVAPAE